MKSDIDFYIMNEVRKKREALDMSQETLSFKIGKTHSFVSNVESNIEKRYNCTHLNDIAKALKCSPKDFFPQDPL